LCNIYREIFERFLSVTDAPLKQKRRGRYQLHGIHARDRALRRHGLDAIDTRSAPGRDAMAWHNAVLEAKGGAACPHAVKVEIKLATFDLFRLLHVQSYLIADCNVRGTIVNRRHRELSPPLDGGSWSRPRGFHRRATRTVTAAPP
jgi:hypothetical protein